MTTPDHPWPPHPLSLFFFLVFLVASYATHLVASHANHIWTILSRNAHGVSMFANTWYHAKIRAIFKQVYVRTPGWIYVVAYQPALARIPGRKPLLHRQQLSLFSQRKAFGTGRQIWWIHIAFVGISFLNVPWKQYELSHVMNALMEIKPTCKIYIWKWLRIQCITVPIDYQNRANSPWIYPRCKCV